MNGLRIDQLSKKLGVKKTKIYSLIQNGDLPQPLKLGKKVSIWLENEIDEALKRLADQRTQSKCEPEIEL